MNNEQNNTFVVPNPAQSNNQTIPGSTVIPGANLTPIAPTDNGGVTPINQVSPDINNSINNVATQPITGQATEQAPITNLNPSPITRIVTGPQAVNPPNIPNTPINTLPNENLISVNSNNVVPGIVNQGSATNNDASINNSNSELNTPRPLNTETSTMNQPILTPNIPVNPTNTSNEPINNNLGDATPLTNEGLSEGGEVISVWKYLGTMVLFCIPIVGQIMLFIKAFGGEKNKNIKNLARAYLLLAVIMVVLSIVFTVVFSAVLASMLGGI